MPKLTKIVFILLFTTQFSSAEDILKAGVECETNGGYYRQQTCYSHSEWISLLEISSPEDKCKLMGNYWVNEQCVEPIILEDNRKTHIINYTKILTPKF